MFCFVNSCQFVILIVSSLFVIRIWIYLYGTWLRDMFHFYYSLVFTKSVNSTFGEFWLAPQLGRSFAIHCSATGAKMASCFEVFSEEEIWAINEAVLQTNTKKATIFCLSVFTGSRKLFSCWICDKIVKMHLTKSLKCS